MNDYLIAKYNRSSNLIFVSPYPEKNVVYSNKVCATGGFAKNTILNFSKTYKFNSKKPKIIILTTIIGNQKEIYQDDGILICRIIERNNPLSFIRLGHYLIRFSQIKNYFIEFEFGSFGNVKCASLFFIIPLLLKILGKYQILILHQVIKDLRDLSGHLGWTMNDLRNTVYNFLLKIYYRGIYMLSDKIVVTEEVFKNRLKKITGNSSKTVVIPHGVDTHEKKISRNQAREILNLPKNKTIIMYFGYLCWYKGADIFLDFAKATRNKKYLFLIAGGKSFTNANKNHYLDYLTKFAKLGRNMILTGFVPEDKICLYYSACDVVVLPYRTMMSSSGPLSLAFSYSKPVVISSNLAPYLKSVDFYRNLNKAKLTPNDIFFKLKKTDFMRVISKLDVKKSTKFAQLMKRDRAYRNIVKDLQSMVENTPKEFLGAPRFSLLKRYG